MKSTSLGLKSIGSVAGAVILVGVFFLNSLQISTHEDFRYSNFAKFWIAGHMVLTGLNPYDPAQWYAQHMSLGATSVPDKIFLYPLPQAFFLVPLALMPPQVSFFVWSILSQVIIALTCLVLLSDLGADRRDKMFVPLVIFLLFFGPIYLTLQVGAIGAVAMAVVLAAIFFLRRHQSLVAGLVLSLVMLKPPQGLPILFFVGLWLLLKRDWKALASCGGGMLVLLASGLLLDRHWLQEFLANSLVVSNRTLGVQSNVWSLSYHACREGASCALVLGGFMFSALLAAGVWFIWRYHTRLLAWETFNLIIPLGFLGAIYLFSYDQILYVFPIIWITSNMLQRTRSYLLVFLFMLVIDVVSLAALFEQARTHVDVLSLVTTVVVLGTYLLLLRGNLRPLAPDAQPA